MSDEAQEQAQTSDELLKQIREKERELKAYAVPESAPASNDNAPEPIPPSDSPKEDGKPATDKPVETPRESKGEDATAPIKGKEDKAAEEWIKKKGFKDVKDVVKSLRELERELHKRRFEEKNAPHVSQFPPIQAPPQYQPPVYQPANEPVINEIARRYQMAPEDLEKIAPFATDLAMAVFDRNIKPLVFKTQSELEDLKRQLKEKTELETLEEDPLFQSPEVQYEMHRILESNPTISQEPEKYRRLFEQATLNVARRKIQEEQFTRLNASSVAPGQTPKEPPATAGGGGRMVGKSGITAQSKVDPLHFAALSLAEKTKILQGMNAFKSE